MSNIIKIIAPSNSMADLPVPLQKTGLERLKALGFSPVISKHANNRHRHLSGTVEERLSDLEIALADDTVVGVMAVFGGYNTSDLLTGLSRLTCPKSKWLIGYSDITALLLPLCEHPNLRAIHGPGFASFCDPNFFPYSEQAFLSAVQQQETTFFSPNILASDFWYLKENYGPRETITSAPWRIYQLGEVVAPILGGNLDTLCSLLGTTHIPDLTNKILFIEASTGNPGLFQRNMMQLKYAGVLSQIAGLIIGAFPADTPLHNQDILNAILPMLNLPDYPVLANVHCSHVDPMLSIPLNRPAKLRALDIPSITIHYAGK